MRRECAQCDEWAECQPVWGRYKTDDGKTKFWREYLCVKCKDKYGEK